jgi:hypothetical protein
VFGKKLGAFMTIQFRDRIEIENLRNLPTEQVASLERALHEGAQACPDPKRPRFYEISWQGKCYYVDLLPGGRRVILLAVWDAETAAAYAHVT